MPPEESVGCDDRRELAEETTTDLPALRGETTTLIVSQPECATVESLFQDAALLKQVRNHVPYCGRCGCDDRGRKLKSRALGRQTAEYRR